VAGDVAADVGGRYRVGGLDHSRAWLQVQRVPVLVPHRKTGEPFKHVWRGIARR
jgi:hypothetical protein